MKINMYVFNEHLEGLRSGDAGARRNAIRGLAKYSHAEWESTVDAASSAVDVLVGADASRFPDESIRVEAAKALGNLGTQSPVVVAELLRLLREDRDGDVRFEAVRALGKIGTGAQSASRALAAVLSDLKADDRLRGEAAWALARTDPLNPETAAALATAVGDRSGHVGVCAAEALWKVSAQGDRAALALAARLRDPAVRDQAVQALYRIGPHAKAAVPVLLAAAKEKDRLFHEAVVMALRKIDPLAAVRAGLG